MVCYSVDIGKKTNGHESGHLTAESLLKTGLITVILLSKRPHY
jgi:hypothetical protein